jgi:zinc transporter
LSSDPTGPDPTPVCAFDIWANGKATPCPDLTVKPVKGAAYRWLHFDLTDSAVPAWLDQNLPHLPASALQTIETRPRVEREEDGLIIALRGVNLNDGAEVTDMVALRLWITCNLIVTVRRRRIYAVDHLRHMAQDQRAPKSTADFLVRLIDILTQRIEEVSLSFDDTVDQLETAVYDDGAQTLPNLSDTRRQVIKLRRFVGPQTDALLRLVTIDSPVIPARLQSHLRETANRATRSVEELAEVRERLTALSEHLDLAQSVRLGRNGYLLSVVAAIFLPLGFLTGLFGVNLGGLPGVGAAGAFWIFCGALVVIGILVFIILKLRKLL